MTKETALAIAGNSPMMAMELALNKNMDIEKLESLLALQEKWEKMEAKKAYTKAMAAFKADPPTIIKDKKVGFNSKKPGAGKTSYSHASLGNVANQIGKAMGLHGLSASWPLEQSEKGVKVTCTITHELGHSESTSLFAGSDNTGNKNSIQAIGSTISYLERYTILALTGLATEDQDDDGVALSYINQDQINTITKLVKDTGADKKAFLEYLGFESIAQIPKRSFNQTMTTLKLKVKKNKKQAKSKEEIVDTKLFDTLEHKEWREIKELFPDESGTVPEPTTQKECLEAVKAVNEIVDGQNT